MIKIKRVALAALCYAALGFSAEGASVAQPRDRFPDWFVGIPVTTSPYLGERMRFDRKDLLIQIPSVNEDLRLLSFRYKGEKSLAKHTFSEPYIKVSGKVTAQASAINPAGNDHHTNDVNLTGAELDVLMAVSPWMTGYFTLNYEASASTGSPVRVDNSRYFLDNGFLTVGNFKASPLYATIGQMVLPFGRYSSAMNSGSLPSSLGQTKTRALLMGYSAKEDGPSASVYVFRGSASIAGVKERLNQGGANIDYKLSKQDYSLGLGASWISHIAEAAGFQTTDGERFEGFGENALTDAFVRRVPGVTMRALVDYKTLNLNVEYVTATRAFDADELTFNGLGAKPNAVNVELGYGFNCAGFASHATVGYAKTQASLALNLPEERYVGTLSTSLYQGTVQSLEFRHDKLYNATATASGAGGTPFSAEGRTTNAVTLNLGLYF